MLKENIRTSFLTLFTDLEVESSSDERNKMQLLSLTRKHTPSSPPDLEHHLGTVFWLATRVFCLSQEAQKFPLPSLSLFLFFQFTFGRGNLCLSCSLVISHSSAVWAWRLRGSTWQCMESAYQRVRGLKLSVSCELLAYQRINLFDQSLPKKPQSFGWGIIRRQAYKHTHTHSHTHLIYR